MPLISFFINNAFEIYASFKFIWGLGGRLRVNQPAYPIREEHVDLLRFNDGGYFTRTIRRMRQVLAGPISTHAIVWSADFGAGAGGPRARSRLERTANATLGATHS